MEILHEILQAEKDVGLIIEQAREKASEAKRRVEEEITEKISAAKNEADGIIGEAVSKAESEARDLRKKILRETEEENRNLLEKKKKAVLRLVDDLVRLIVTTGFNDGTT